MLEKKWIKKQKPNPNDVAHLIEVLGIHPVLCKLLAQRGMLNYAEAKSFFRPNAQSLHDPFLMKNMEVAIDRIDKAIDNKENIMIYGDYDVDGTTAVAMVYTFLLKIYPDITYYVPDRYAEGYGISYQGIDFAEDNDISLIIALDCGIKAIEKVEYANERNIDFIICDHHLPGKKIPEAIVLNPKQNDCLYPFKELSGAGVGFKLLQGYSKKHNINLQHANTYLDLLAISIGADMVPLEGENRVLAQFGMAKLNEAPSIGVKAILNEAGIDRDINMRDIGFAIGPRINAAGRIAHASKAVELLIADCQVTAAEGSEDVSLDNAERRILDAETTKQALTLLHSNEDHQNKKTTVIYHQDWHKGILGIVANRLQETYYRPTIVLTKSGDLFSGSARSVNGYHLYNAINECSELLESFGGHAFAAGLTIKEENIAEFSSKFETIVSKNITQEQLTPSVLIDAELPINDIKNTFYKVLTQFEPFGQNNEQPIFYSAQVKAMPGVRLLKSEHIKMDLVDFNQPANKIPAIAFKQAKHYDYVVSGKPFSVCYSLEMNEWKNNKTLQAVIKDIKPCT